MNAVKNFIIFSLIIIATAFYFLVKSKIHPLISSSSTQILMDTVVTVKIYGKNRSKLDSIIDDTFRYMRKLEKKLSNYIDSSEISKINKNAGIKPVKVSALTIDFLKKSIKLCKMSGGYLDITIGRLINLWGFPSGHPHLPDKKDIKEALKYKGLDLIKINSKKNTVFIEKKGVKIDVGAVAKGYIVDKAIEFLKKKGIKKGVINAGGDLRFIGFKDHHKYWVVGIKNPDLESKQEIIKTVKVGNWAIATSGDYERYFIYKGKRYCHILNPFTGYSADYFRSVTVEADTALNSDAIATAIFAMGKNYKKYLKNFKSIKHFKIYLIKNKFTH